MAITDTDGKYSTKTTSLAAYLLTEGFDLTDVSIEHIDGGYKTVATFVFESNNELLSCVKQFQIGRAEGNLVLFFESYRKCLRMTKVGKF